MWRQRHRLTLGTTPSPGRHRGDACRGSRWVAPGIRTPKVANERRSVIVERPMWMRKTKRR